MIDPVRLDESTDEALAAARGRRDDLVAAATRDASSVVRAYDLIAAPLVEVRGWVDLFESVHPDADVRAACEGLRRRIARFDTELALDRGLFDVLVAVDPGALADDGERRLLRLALRDFRRAGVDRDEATRERIAALRDELLEIGQAFSRNIIEDGRELVVPEGHARLGGLPADFLRSHPEREDGSVALTTDPSDWIPVITFADDDALRREFFLVKMQCGLPANVAVLDALLARRHELAELLGYATWADYFTETMMTGDGATVSRFLDRLAPLVSRAAERDVEDLLALARERDPELAQLGEWARVYWTERLRQRRAGFDAREARPYLPYEACRDGLLAVSADVYGVEYVRSHDAPRWSEEVEVYDVVRDGETLARFYFDMHPRPGKFKHAAMFNMNPGGPTGELPSGAIVCNFPRPTADDPALLLHDQLTTLFHEFGHLMHFLLGGRQPLLSFAGGERVEWDFVEVPSQLYEEWAWDAGVLRRFARHHETGEPIPVEMVERMQVADRTCRALNTVVQLYYARFSLELYRADPAQVDPVRLAIEVKQELLPLPHTDGNWFHLSFGHLDGYSAAYYTYLWSLVIAKDLFGAFEGQLDDGERTRAYAAQLLEPGSSRDAAAMVDAFLGRPYGFEPFERWLTAS